MYNKDYYKTAINLIPQDIVDKYDLIEKKTMDTPTSGWKTECMA